MRALLAALLALAAVLPAAAQPSAPAGLEVTGANLAELDDRSGLWTLRGAPVVVRRGAMVLRAPLIVYDTRARTAHASGGVGYEDGRIVLSAAEMTVWTQEDRFDAAGGVSAVQGAEPEQIHLQAARVQGFVTERRLVATGDPRITAPEGTIEADRIEVAGQRDELTGEGHARIRHEDIDGRAPRLLVRRRDELAVLSGGAVVRQGDNEARAETVTLDLRRRRITASGAASVTVQTGR